MESTLLNIGWLNPPRPKLSGKIRRVLAPGSHLRESMAEYHRTYREANREKRRAQQRERYHRIKDRPRVINKAQKAAYDRKYYLTHRAQILSRKRGMPRLSADRDEAGHAA